MKKVVITGATGFVGQHLLEDLLPTKHTIRFITRTTSKKLRVDTGNCEVAVADLSNYESLKSAFRNIDTIVNIAAEVRNSNLLAETNIKGIENLIAAAKVNNVSKIIHLSSVGVVGMQYSTMPVIIDENSKCEPKNEYERTKLESERLLIEASKTNNFKLDIIRPTNVFGEHHPFNALLNLISYINSGKLVFGTSAAMVNYVYVKDLTSLIIQLIDDENQRGIINIGTSESFKKFISIINGLLGKKVKSYSLPSLVIKCADILNFKKLNAISNQVIYSDEKLRTFYKYPFGLEKGLQNTIDHYKKNNLVK